MFRQAEEIEEKRFKKSQMPKDINPYDIKLKYGRVPPDSLQNVLKSSWFLAEPDFHNE